ncbi:hypothetical protein BH11BAC3_BH11BAC3_25930 [soil metagenome]
MAFTTLIINRLIVFILKREKFPVDLLLNGASPMQLHNDKMTGKKIL